MPARDYICHQCGKTTRRKESTVRTEKVFCSRQCYGVYRKLNSMSDFTCENCGKTIRRLRSTVPQGRKVFCDIKCNLEYKGKNRKKKKPPKVTLDGILEKKGFRYVCPNCGSLLRMFGAAYECMIHNEGTSMEHGCGTMYLNKRELEKATLEKKEKIQTS